jgi:hypothetical protein
VRDPSSQSELAIMDQKAQIFRLTQFARGAG